MLKQKFNPRYHNHRNSSEEQDLVIGIRKKEMESKAEQLSNNIFFLQAKLRESETKNNLLTRDNESLKKENSTLKAVKEEFEALKINSKEKIDNVNKELSETRKQIIEKNKVLESLEIRFKNILGKVLDLSEQEIQEKSIKDLEQIFGYIETHKIKTKKKESEDVEEPFNEEAYLENNLCLCGSEKQGNSKGCPKCRTEADRLRKKFGISMEEAWVELWKSYGKNMDKSMEYNIEN